jgi:hypothetical protein
LKVLNVGGGDGKGPLPRFEGWENIVLDIDPETTPDICMDAREMASLPGGEYDAVFCSHNLEHYYKHEVPTVLGGFSHVLKEDGYAEIIVPNIMKLIEALKRNSLDLMDTWYRTSSGVPITFHDVLYGWGQAIEKGNLYYAHHCGWTQNSLCKELISAGFKGGVQVWEDDYNIYARAFKQEKDVCQSPLVMQKAI